MAIEIRHQPLTPEQIREELDRFEERYGLPSNRRLEAFDADGRCDSSELDRWSDLYLAWTLVQQGRR